jgi:SAM-dependent methyltransferase
MTQEPYTGHATTFDTAAERYERARPGYPPALFTDLSATLGAHAAHARVLEIGPGTGQATRGLLEQGWSVVALEPGARLAAVARRVLAGRGAVDVVEQPFERWDAGDRAPFDLVLAATSWHWVDPRVGYRRAAELLRPGGHLAVVATEHVLPPDGDDFFRQVEAAYDEVGLGDGRGGPAHPDTIEPPDVAAMRAQESFADPVVHRYLWAQEYTAEEYVTLLSTYSNHIAASPEQRDTLFARVQELIARRPSGTVRKHYLTLLQTARRAG